MIIKVQQSWKEDGDCDEHWKATKNKKRRVLVRVPREKRNAKPARHKPTTTSASVVNSEARLRETGESPSNRQATPPPLATWAERASRTLREMRVPLPSTAALAAMDFYSASAAASSSTSSSSSSPSFVFASQSLLLRFARSGSEALETRSPPVCQPA